MSRIRPIEASVGEDNMEIGMALVKSFAESPAACRGDECMPYRGGYKGERSVPLILIILIGPCVEV